MPKHVGAVDSEVVKKGDDVGRGVGRGQCAVDVGGTAVSLQFHGDDAMALRETGDELGEVEVDAQQAAVQQDQRSASFAVHLEVQVQAVDVGIPRRAGARGRVVRGC